MRALRSATLLVGGSGFLGGLVAAALLVSRRRLLVAVRPTTAPVDCVARIRVAILDLGLDETEADELIQLVSVVELPTLDRLSDLDEVVRAVGVDEIAHCAGCVDYFSPKRLQLANVDLTRGLVDAARRWRLRRILYLSTAFCGGYQADLIREQLHPEPNPKNEPTDYTRSKRAAEWLIADSGVPFVIIRPSIVIGNSRTGVYLGKNYGLYQMWRATEGLLCREYAPIWHTVAPPAPVDLVHQDAFQAAFLGIYRKVPVDSIVHLVANPMRRPTMRELAWLWADIYCPLEIRAYPEVDDVPLSDIPIRQRRFLEIAAKNLEISVQPWNFETRHMDELRTSGLQFADATLETISRCQSRYIQGSDRIRDYVRQHAGSLRNRPRLIEMRSPTRERAELGT